MGGERIAGHRTPGADPAVAGVRNAKPARPGELPGLTRIKCLDELGTAVNAMALLRRTAEWAWERDEVDRPSSKRTVRFTAVLYVVALVAIVLAGGVLSAAGHRGIGGPLLVFGIWFTGFAGSVNVSWEWLKYRSERRDAAASGREREAPERELAPDIRIADDTKIGFVVTLVGLCAMYLSFELATLVASYM